MPESLGEIAVTSISDPARLQALTEMSILDTGPEDLFDDIVHLAGRLCATSMALVSFVDQNRSWCKARIGFPFIETDLRNSICKYALEVTDLLIIPDLVADLRTQNSSLVTDPGIRFYAGAPLRTRDGHVLGTLSAIDTVARPQGLSPAQQEDLRRLARQTMAQLQARRSIPVRIASELALIASNHRNAALVKIGDRLRDLTDPPAIVLTAAEIMGQTLGAFRAGYAIVDTEHDVLTAFPDWYVPGTLSLAGSHKLSDLGNITEELIQGKNVVVIDVETDPRTKRQAEVFKRLGIRSLVTVPLIEHGKLVALEFVHFDRVKTWSEDEDLFVRNVADRTRSGIAQARASEQQAILNIEISHRLKNSMAMVQAIASQTLKGVSDRYAVDAFDQRLRALSNAHDILLAKDWASADLMELVTGAMSNVAEIERYFIQGPKVTLGPRAAVSTSLMLHELATNAMKYGALSVPNGHVDIKWTIEAKGSIDTLTLRWAELNGPDAAPPEKKGFGSRLLNMGLVGTGGTSLNYARSGLEASFEASLQELVAA